MPGDEIKDGGGAPDGGIRFGDVEFDLGGGDITTASTVEPRQSARGIFLVKSDCVLAGLDIAFVFGLGLRTAYDWADTKTIPQSTWSIGAKWAFGL